MKRDMNLIRKILLKVEELPTIEKANRIVLDGYDQGTVSFHIGLLVEQGLVKAKPFRGNDETTWYPLGLTNAGYDFVDKIKDDTAWNKVRPYLQSFGKMTLPLVLQKIVELLSPPKPP